MNNFKLAIILITILFLGLLGCFKNYERATELPSNPYFIYVEDVIGKDGLCAGNYGEIVALDLITKEKSILTKDSFFDRSPNVIQNKNTILYESKRKISAHDYGQGLGVNSKLCSLNVSSGQVEVLRFGKRSLEGEDYLEMSMPVIAHMSNKVALCASGLFRKKWRVYIYDLDTDSLQMLVNIPAEPLNIVWSNDDTRIAFERGGPETVIFIVDVEEQKVDTLSLKEYKFTLGDIRNDSLLYVSRYVPKVGKLGDCAIEIMSLKSKKKSTIYVDTSNLWVESPKFGDGANIFFIKEPEHRGDYNSRDIYSFDLQRKTISRITSDGRDKADLNFISHPANATTAR